jgi:uncharacterized SAM-dependent methyltransferase
MHLRSLQTQTVIIQKVEFRLRSDETIWTESCHKYAKNDAPEMARRTGFECVAQWIDVEWQFAENLFVAV